MTRKISCPASALAEKAVRLVREYNAGNCAVGEKIIELEEAGTRVLAESRRGVEFQLGLLQTILDDLVARIPEDAPARADRRATGSNRAADLVGCSVHAQRPAGVVRIA